MTTLVVQSCGPGTSLQDHGRFGWQKVGLGPAGAMDRLAQAQANALVSNAPGAAVIELALAGIKLQVEDGACRVALMGAAMPIKIDGMTCQPSAAMTAHAGQVIEVGSARTGRFGYLAVAGGFDLPLQLGSLALHMRAAVGGIDGRALRAGDRLPLHLKAPSGPDLMASRAIHPGTGPIRVILGPQDDHFTKAGVQTFLSAPYTITANADRMGMRLTGAPIEHGPKGYNIVSDGIATGAIQVPGSGEPLILLADRQTTGGYPKIAAVVTADLPRLGQAGPGDLLHFIQVTRGEALTALRAQVADIVRFTAGLRPAGPVGLDSAALLALNLVDGWIAAGSD
jgi:5-oxoprolinase (ATP-hydrolysing) subunit C